MFSNFTFLTSKLDSSTRSSRNQEFKYTSYELSKNKIYESNRNVSRESRKRSSSRDRSKQESPKQQKYTKNYENRRSSHRSSSRKHSSRASNRSSDKLADGGFLSKVKSTSNLGHKYPHTASLKFNNILKDMGGY